MPSSPLPSAQEGQTAPDKLIKSCQDLSVLLHTFNIFIYTPVFDSTVDVPAPDNVTLEELVGDSMSELATAMLDLMILPLMKESLGSPVSAAATPRLPLDDQEPIGDSSFLDQNIQQVVAMDDKKDFEEKGIEKEALDELEVAKEALTIHALKLISYLCRYSNRFQ